MTILGIDFGTSRIKAAYWDEGRGEAVMLPLGKGGRLYVPSLFHVAKDGRIRFGDEAEMMLHHDPLGVLENLKLKLDKPIQYTPSGIQVKSAELLTLLFGRLIEYASQEIKQFNSKQPENLVLTLPSRWDYGDIYRDALDAAGFHGEITFLREPEAAGWAWSFEEGPKAGTMLVVLDFGGGTVDWATVKVDENGRPRMIPELPPGGITAAGAHVDEGLFNEMMKHLDTVQREYTLVHRPLFIEQIRQMKESQSCRATFSCGVAHNLEVILGSDVYSFPRSDFSDVVKREAVEQAREGVGSYVRKVFKHVRNEGNTQVVCVLVGGSRLLSGLEEQIKGRVREIAEENGSNIRYAELSQADFATVKGAVRRGCPEHVSKKAPSLASAAPNVSPDDMVMSIHNLAVRGDAESQYRLGRLYEEGQQIKQVYEEAVRWYSLAAAQENMHAQYSLGVMYEYGRGVDQSDELAAQWYRLAAEQGESISQYLLGCMCESGQGVPKSNEEAAKWYRLAAEKGDIKAQFIFGTMCLDGRGVSQNDEEASTWFLLAAEKGDVRAQYNLGMMYREARGVLQSNEKAAKWYRYAAEQGNVGAQLLLGKMYFGEWGGTYLPQEAVKWFQMAADQGDSTAQYYLGIIYFSGIGVEENKEIANTWFQRSAEQANESALFKLIENYTNGIGVPKSETEVVKWCRFGAEKGIARAQKEYGFRKMMGQGVSKSYSEALKWFQRAADQGYSEAMFAIGTMYENGWGVPKCEEDSMKWYRLAAGKGNVDMKIEVGIKSVKKWWRNL